MDEPRDLCNFQPDSQVAYAVMDRIWRQGYFVELFREMIYEFLSYVIPEDQVPVMDNPDQFLDLLALRKLGAKGLSSLFRERTNGALSPYDHFAANLLDNAWPAIIENHFDDEGASDGFMTCLIDSDEIVWSVLERVESVLYEIIAELAKQQAEVLAWRLADCVVERLNNKKAGDRQSLAQGLILYLIDCFYDLYQQWPPCDTI